MLTKKKLLNTISYSYCFVAIFIVFTTLCFAGLHWEVWPPEATLPNYLYYIGAVAVLLAIYKLKDIRISDKVFWVITSILTLIFLYIQVDVSLWFPEGQHADFWWIYTQSHMLVQGKGFSDPWLLDYFRHFEDINLDKLYLFTLIFKLTGSWRAVIIVGALLMWCSCFVASHAIRNLTHNNVLSIIFYVLAFVSLGLNWRAYLPYSDNYAIVFPMLCIYVMTTNISLNKKFAWFSLFAILAYFMKHNTFVLIIALCLVYLLTSNKQEVKQGLTKFAKVGLPIFVGAYILLSLFTTVNSNYYGYTPEVKKEQMFPGYDTAKLLYEYVYIGQNNPGFGTTGFIENDGKNGFQHFFDRAFWGNVKFFTIKTMITYRDGEYSSVQKKAQPKELKRCKDSGRYQYMLQGSDSYPYFMGLEQIIWNLILIGLVLFAFAKKDFLYYVLTLTFIGVYIYLMIFETRSKYLLPFVPIFFTMAACGINSFKFGLLKRHMSE